MADDTDPRVETPGTRRTTLAPGLHVVATPIGNLRDITLRALDTLGAADAVLCEDTRLTGRLLAHYGLKRPLMAYHEHNAEDMRPKVLGLLAAGQRLALVSDAGTPLISDPGFKLVRQAAAAGHAIFTVPGPSAVTAALSIAGLPTNRFLFVGFLPPKTAARRSALAPLRDLAATLVLLEAPQRLAGLLGDLAEILGERPAAVARELTKIHEEVRRGPLPALAAHYGKGPAPKGEIVVLIGPGAAAAVAPETLDAALRAALAGGLSLKDAAAAIAAQHGLSRREVYARGLALKAGADA